MENKEIDVAVIGSGPAGLQAAIHSARKKVRTTVFGKLSQSSLGYAHVENYCCMRGVVHGKELLEDGRRQAERFGAVFVAQDITAITKTGAAFELRTEDGSVFTAGSLIFTLGVKRKALNVKGELEYHGKGVSYCVECDANFFRGRNVIVTGEGSAAASGAILLTAYASSVELVSGKLEVDEALKRQLAASGVKLSDGVKISGIEGADGRVTGVKLSDGTARSASGVFIELGAKGAMELAVQLGVELHGDKFEYIKTDKLQRTSVPGVYAAGDICGAPFQLAKAIGEGCVAGLNAADYVSSLRRVPGK